MAEQRRREEQPSPPLVSYDGGKTWTEALIHRGKPWRWEIILVAGLSLMIGGMGWFLTKDIASDAKMAANDANAALEQIEEFAADLRDSAVSGCQRQNKVRKQQHVIQRALRDMLKDQNEANRRIQPSDFPSIGEQRFERLVHRGIKRNQEARAELKPILPLAPCEQIYPQPEEDGPNAG